MHIPRRRLLIVAALAAGLPASVPAHDEAARARTTRVLAARRQVTDLLSASQIEGRFVERLPGSYLLAPRGVGLPQLPILNPEAVSALAVGPVVVVKGQVDAKGRLRVDSYMLKPPSLVRGLDDALPQRAETASNAILSTLGAAIRPGAMNAADRSLEGPSPMASTTRQNIREIVIAYRDALNAGNAAAVAAIVADWAELRTTIRCG